MKATVTDLRPWRVVDTHGVEADRRSWFRVNARFVADQLNIGDPGRYRVENVEDEPIEESAS